MSLAKVRGERKVLLFVVPVTCLLLAAWPALAQGNIATIAGNGTETFSGDGGLAATAGLHHPRGLAVDSNGNVYVSDVDNRRIRRVSSGGMISTVAGNGTTGYSGDGGLAVNAALSEFTSLALDPAGNLYIADASNRRVRMVTPGGIISTIAGTGIEGFSGDGGPAINAQLGQPTSVLFSAGNLYITDSSKQRIRKVSSDGTITTIAGNGVKGFSGDGGQAISASIQTPMGMAMDRFGNLYFADADNNRVRRISPNGVINTVAGDGIGRFAGDQGLAINASLNIPEDVAVDDAGNLFIADSGNNRVRKVDSAGLISTLAGTGTDGFSGDGGPAAEAMLNFPWGLTTNATGSVYIADRVNNRIRMVSQLVAGQPTLADNSTVNAASFTLPFAPGAIVAVFGTGFAGSTMSPSRVPLPTVLGDTSVTFNGIAAPLFYAANGQINAQAPFELPAGSTVSIQVRRGSTLSAVRTANLAVVAPGIFIVDQAHSTGAVLHASDASLVSSSAPARSGEYLVIYCTGLGPLLTPVRSGDPAPINPLAHTIYFPDVTIAGVPAVVTYSGLTPTFVGLYQINVQVPAGLPAGNQSLRINLLGVTSNTATIAVAP